MNLEPWQKKFFFLSSFYLQLHRVESPSFAGKCKRHWYTHRVTSHSSSARSCDCNLTLIEKVTKRNKNSPRTWYFLITFGSRFGLAIPALGETQRKKYFHFETKDCSKNIIKHTSVKEKKKNVAMIVANKCGVLQHVPGI